MNILFLDIDGVLNPCDGSMTGSAIEWRTC